MPAKPNQLFLNGSVEVKNSFVVTAATEYLKRVLKYLNQNLDQQSVFVTASTGKAATAVNGIALHSTFHCPVKSGLKSYAGKKHIDKTLHILRNRYQYLKVLIIDEILMTGRETLEHLDLV